MHPYQASCTGKRFLIQQIMGIGHLKRNGYRYCLPLDECATAGNNKIISVKTCGMPTWKTISLCNRQLLLQVEVPLMVTLSTCGCRQITVPSSLCERVCIQLQCVESEIWRYSLYLDTAVRQTCCCELFPNQPCQVSLDVIIDAYLLSPCIVQNSNQDVCPTVKPWYPLPMK